MAENIQKAIIDAMKKYKEVEEKGIALKYYMCRYKKKQVWSDL